MGVSAPTLESAVAAAAMAQDELGHARSTYPVLKALGVEPTTTVDAGGHRLALLDDELPDWTAFVAANLLVDGVLTTFVAACADSSIDADGQRARKILQEEGSHRVHARGVGAAAVPRGAERDALLARLRRRGRRPAAGRARTTTRATARRSRPGWSARPGRPARAGAGWLAGSRRGGSRGHARRAGRLVGLGPRARGAVGAVALPVLRRRRSVERVGQWGGQIITSQWRCRACGSYFEALRDDFDDRPGRHSADEAR